MKEVEASGPNRQGANISDLRWIRFVVARITMYRIDLRHIVRASGMPLARTRRSSMSRRKTHSCSLRGPHSQSAGE